MLGHVQSWLQREKNVYGSRAGLSRIEPRPFRFPAVPPRRNPAIVRPHRMEDSQELVIGRVSRPASRRSRRPGASWTAAASRLNPCAASRTPCGVREPPTAFRKSPRPPPALEDATTEAFPKALEKLLGHHQDICAVLRDGGTRPASSHRRRSLHHRSPSHGAGILEPGNPDRRDGERSRGPLLEEKKVSLILLDLIPAGYRRPQFPGPAQGTPIPPPTSPSSCFPPSSGPSPRPNASPSARDAYYEKPFEVETICAAVSAWLYRTEGNLRESRRDHLTGLPNRALSARVMPETSPCPAAVANPSSAAILDLDRFKYINDTFGHAAGDEVLRRTGAILTGALRQIRSHGPLGAGGIRRPVPPTTSMEGAGMAVRKALEALSAQKFPGLRGTYPSMSPSPPASRKSPPAGRWRKPSPRPTASCTWPRPRGAIAS